MLSVILPTKDEEGNIGWMIEEVSKALKPLDIIYEIIVIDANSTDSTVDVVETFIEKGLPVSVYVTPEMKGLAWETYYGFQFAKYDLLAVMDTDRQHHPRYLPSLIEAIENDSEVDMVIGSRYAKGGGLGDWALHRKIISKFTVAFTKTLTGISDPITQYYIIRRKVLEGADINAEGMRLSLILITKGNTKEIVEIPIVFQSRVEGETTQNLGRVLTDVKIVIQLSAWRVKKKIFPNRSVVKPNGSGKV